MFGGAHLSQPRVQTRTAGLHPSVPENQSSGRLAHLDVGCLLTAPTRIIFNLEADLIAFVERWQASALQCGDVNKNVLAAILRSNEAETFGVVEELYGAVNSHGGIPFPSKLWIDEAEPTFREACALSEYRGRFVQTAWRHVVSTVV